MAEKLPTTDKEGLPGAPPLFVTAFSKDGKRYESLIESTLPAPDWFGVAHHIRVQAPSGELKDASFADGESSDFYNRCLALVGPKRAWAPDVPDVAAHEMVVGLELWTYHLGEASVTTGPMLTLRRADARKGKPLFRGDVDLSCYAVVRRKDKTSVHVLNSGRFYLDLLPLDNGPEPVPRALLDTSLAGAFWGFSEHQNATAARLAAKRLLWFTFEKPSNLPAPWMAAAGHAVLGHHDLLLEYGDKVLTLLRRPDAPTPDSLLLLALIGMKQLGVGKGDKRVVKDDLRAAITALSEKRAIFGETVRWLDAKYSVLREIALKETCDDKLKYELTAVSEWLGKSYAGGQVAAYLGEAPIQGVEWHDVLAQKKLR